MHMLQPYSWTFDSLPHDLLLGKLRTYGLSDNVCALIGSYLASRWQQVKLGAHIAVNGLRSSRESRKGQFSVHSCSTYFLFQINLLFITMLMIIICLIPNEFNIAAISLLWHPPLMLCRGQFNVSSRPAYGDGRKRENCSV